MEGLVESDDQLDLSALGLVTTETAAAEGHADRLRRALRRDAELPGSLGIELDPDLLGAPQRGSVDLSQAGQSGDALFDLESERFEVLGILAPHGNPDHRSAPRPTLPAALVADLEVDARDDRQALADLLAQPVQLLAGSAAVQVDAGTRAPVHAVVGVDELVVQLLAPALEPVLDRVHVSLEHLHRPGVVDLVVDQDVPAPSPGRRRFPRST